MSLSKMDQALLQLRADRSLVMTQLHKHNLPEGLVAAICRLVDDAERTRLEASTMLAQIDNFQRTLDRYGR